MNFWSFTFFEFVCLTSFRDWLSRHTGQLKRWLPLYMSCLLKGRKVVSADVIRLELTHVYKSWNNGAITEWHLFRYRECAWKRIKFYCNLTYLLTLIEIIMPWLDGQTVHSFSLLAPPPPAPPSPPPFVQSTGISSVQRSRKKLRLLRAVNSLIMAKWRDEYFTTAKPIVRAQSRQICHLWTARISKILLVQSFQG